MPAGAMRLAEINSADWSLELDSTAGAGPGSGLGNVVQGLDDVAQCVAIILTTPPGSDPLRPTFACDLWQFLDAPLSRVLPKIVAAVTSALQTWEPRIKVLGVTAAPVAANPGQVEVSVTWQLDLGETPAPRVTTASVG